MLTLALLLWLIFFIASGVARYWIVRPHNRRPQSLQANEPLQLIGFLGLFCLLTGCLLSLNFGGHGLRVLLILAGGIAYDQTLRWCFVGREAYRVRQRSRCSHYAAVRTVQIRAGYRAMTDFLPAGLRRRLSHQKTDLTGNGVNPYDAR